MTDAPSISQQRFREGKAPSTRLLDLLAGWEAYVKADEEQGVVDLALSSKDLHELLPGSAIAGAFVASRWSGCRYHAVGTAVGGGHDAKLISYVPNGAPRLFASPAPFSNRIRIGLSDSYAASAAE